MPISGRFALCLSASEFNMCILMWDYSVGLIRASMRLFRDVNSSYTFSFLSLNWLRVCRFLLKKKIKWKPLYKTLFQSLTVRSGFFKPVLLLVSHRQTLVFLDVYKLHTKMCQVTFSFTAPGLMHKSVAVLGQMNNSLRCISSLQ